MAKATGRSAFEAKWAALRRSSPLSTVPNPLSPFAQMVYLNAMLIPYYLLLLPAMIYWTYQWLTLTSWPEWTYSFAINNRKGAFWGWLCAGYLSPPDPEDMRWDMKGISPAMRELYGDAETRGEVKTEVIKLYPVPQEMRVGIGGGDWVKEEVVPGMWLSPKASKGKGDEKAKPGEKVILHIHGGGYVAGHPWWNNLALAVVKRTQVRLLSVNYRKPLLPHTAFPAPLLDVLSGYLHLTRDLGFDPSQITLFGKSAGGHLSLMLSRYLSDLSLSHPQSIVMMAPWCDFQLCQPSYKTNRPFDYLTPEKLSKAVSASMRWFKPEAMNELYFNPVLGKARDWKYLANEGVKVYMMVGTKELFADEVYAVGKAMKEAAGAEVQVRGDPNGLHTSAMWVPGPLAIFVDDVAATMGL